ncbi:CHAT domain-containing protein [Spongiimicrobium salis]|uniref:CHAT domain-containing protein n=1 Tax=Spongiimicrobium salis TaxID=1667022 RepID=UPI00374DE1DC
MFLIFFSGHKTTAQERSVLYSEIVTDSVLSINHKEKKADSLFAIYQAEGKFKILIQDLRHHANWFYGQKKYDKAVASAKKGLSLYQHTVTFNENLHGQLLYNLALYHSQNQEYLKAIRVYQKLISLNIDGNFTARSHSQIGFNYTKLGDFHNALNFHTKAEQLLWNNKAYDAYFRDRLYAANACRLLNEPTITIEGIKSLMKAKHRNDSLKGQVRDRSFTLYKRIAQLLHGEEHLAHLGNAMEYYEKALDIALQQKRSSRIASTYNDIAALHMDKKEYALANTFYKKALNYSGSDDDVLSYIYYSQSLLLATTEHNYKEALELSKKAIALASGVSETWSPEQSALETYSSAYDKVHLLELLKIRAILWMEYYDKEPQKKYLENALQLFSISDKLIDIIRFQSIEQASKFFWRKEGADLYYRAVAVSYKLNKPDKAFYFMEKNKAILLLEDIAYERRKSATSLPDSLLSKEYELKKAILWEEEELAYTSSVKAQDSIKEVLGDTKREYSNFINQLQNQHPDYYYLKKPAIIRTLQDSKKEGPFIAYMIPSTGNMKKGYGLFSNQEHQMLFELPETQVLNAKIKTFKKEISRPFITKEEVQHFQKHSAELYDILIPKKIQALIGEKAITIIPDGNTQNIPFEALISNRKLGQYFIQSNSIHYAYSLSFLKESKNLNRSAGKIYGGFAPLTFDYITMSTLKNSVDEIQSAQELFGGDAYSAKTAQLDSFITRSNDYKILHLATHADATDSISPWVAFADQKMTLNDLYTIKTQADLVVLSACNTSLGELKTGEGVMSLARGFFNSGSKSVLSSLWVINDKSSKVLIHDFYTQLEQGNSKADALRKAKLNYLKNHEFMEASPYYWASFVLIGDGGELGLPQTNWLLFIGSTLLLLFFIVVLKYKSFKSSP